MDVTFARSMRPSSRVGTGLWFGLKMSRYGCCTSTANSPARSALSGWQRSGGVDGTSAKHAAASSTVKRRAILRPQSAPKALTRSFSDAHTFSSLRSLKTIITVHAVHIVFLTLGVKENCRRVNSNVMTPPNGHLRWGRAGGAKGAAGSQVYADVPPERVTAAEERRFTRELRRLGRRKR